MGVRHPGDRVLLTALDDVVRVDFELKGADLANDVTDHRRDLFFLAFSARTFSREMPTSCSASLLNKVTVVEAVWSSTLTTIL